MSGTLYLIPVGLGASDDAEASCATYLPPLTQETACRLRHFVVENAKTARAWLKAWQHPLPLRELDIQVLPEKSTPEALLALLAPLAQGEDMGLLSEAGCPAIADPGALLVRKAHETGVRVRPLVGPSSLLLALMASGLDGQQFAFHGYLPAREPERSRKIAELEKESRQKRQTQLFIETPYRNRVLFEALLTACQPETRLCVASDVSLATEEIKTRRIAAWRNGAMPHLERRPTVFLLLSSD